MSCRVALGFALIALLGHRLASAQTVDANPYTGEPLSLEQLARELESAKAQTAVLEEQLKQGQLRMQLNVLPVKERTEVRQLESQAKPLESAEHASVPPKSKETPKKPEPAAPPPAPKVALSGIIRSGSQTVAVLDVNGSALAVHTAERTPFGMVSILDDRRIRLGDQELAVREFALSRMTISDPKPVVEKAGASNDPTGGGAVGSNRFALPPPLPLPVVAPAKKD